MRKRILAVILVAAMLLIGVAGQALAYFDETRLIRVVYNLEGDYEVMTDLGTGLNYKSASTQNTLLDDNNFSLSQLGISDWSNVYVSYFAITTAGVSGANAFWLSGSNDSLNIAKGKWNGSSSMTMSVLTGAAATGNAQNVQLQSGEFAYSNLIGQTGSFYSSYTTTPTVHKSLAGFDVAGEQYVDQYLYYFSTPNNASAGLKVATIRTYENGTTEINPTAVPVPAAVYLLGSGLLALVGIRRKSQMEG